MATASTGPLIPRRRLGAALRDLREARAETLQQTARALMFSPSKLSRIENGLAGEPHPRDVRDLVAHFGLDDTEQAAHLEQLAAEGRVPGWWQVPPFQMPSRLDTFISWESSASSIEAYVPTVIPGLLQTPDYAAAALRRLVPHLSEGEIEQQVDLRMLRQQHLRAREPMPTLEFTVPETVLHRQVGSAAIMRHQLATVMAISKDPRVRFHVIPFTAGLYQATDTTPMTLFHFADPDDPDVIALETVSTIQFLEGEDRIRRHRAAFAELADVRLGPPASREFLAQFTPR